MTEQNAPKSYLTDEEREKYLQAGGMRLVCIVESRLADTAGDSETSLAWLKQTKLTASSLNIMKQIKGLQFIKDNNFNIENAIAKYGEDWAIR